MNIRRGIGKAIDGSTRGDTHKGLAVPARMTRRKDTHMSGNRDAYATLKQMVVELCEIEDSLSGWEVDFVEAMSHRPETYRFTPKEAAKIEELHERHC